MRNELNQIELIEAYLLGNLSPEELAAFETRLQHEHQLANEVEMQGQLTKRFHRGMMVAALDDAHGQWLRNQGGGGNLPAGTATWVTIGLLAVASFAAWWWISSAETQHGISESEAFALIDTTTTHMEAPTAQMESSLQLNEVLGADSEGTGANDMDNIDADSLSPGAETTVSHSREIGSGIEHRKGAFRNKRLSRASSEEDIEVEQLINEPSLTETNRISTTLDIAPLEQIPLTPPDKVLWKDPAPFSPVFDTFVIDPTQKQLLNYEEGRAVITIPADLLVDAKGNALQEAVTVVFRDFKTNGDLITETIPMHWETGKDISQFESAGMYEIRAFTNSGDVFIKPSSEEPLTVTYAIDTSVQDLNFYLLNDTTGEWRRKAGVKLIETSIEPFSSRDDLEEGSRQENIRGGKTVEGMSLLELLLEIVTLGTIGREKRKQIDQKWGNTTKSGMTVEEARQNDKGVPTPVAAPLPEVNPIQQHPLSQFGFYNYDRLRAMRNRVTLRINALDSTGTSITGISCYVVIEHGTLAAYRYYYNTVFLSPREAYDLVLLTDDNRIFYCTYHDFEEILTEEQQLKAITFSDVTDFVKSPQDFDKLLYVSRQSPSKEATAHRR